MKLLETTDTQVSYERSSTAWLAISLLYFAGCTTALHIGKIPVALPVIQNSWQLSLTQSGFIISLHSILIATCGLLLGVMLRRLGYISFAILGVGTVGVGSLLGSFATSMPLLLLGRSIEGLGWIVSAIALPSLISALSTPKDRALVMAAWASFLPVGAGVMLLCAPLLQRVGGWQLSWLLGSAVSFVAAFIVYQIVRKNRQAFINLRGQSGATDYSDLRKPIVWLMSACFMLYSFSYIPLISFLPLLLVDTANFTLSFASSIAALVMLCNSIGSVASGLCLRRGYSPAMLLVFAALISGLCALFVFAPLTNTALRIVCALLFSMFGGVIPGVLFSTMPKAASNPVSIGLLIGFMMQCAGVGMLLGGVTVPGAVDYFHAWSAAGWVILFTAACSALLAYCGRCPIRQL